MRIAPLLTVLAFSCLSPFSLAAQLVSPVPVPVPIREPMPIPLPAIHVAGPVPLELLPLSSALPIAFPDSDRDLPVQEQYTTQKSRPLSGVHHRSLQLDNAWRSIDVA